MKIAIITFLGTNCDNDSYIAIKKIIKDYSYNAKIYRIFYRDNIPDDIDLIILPGGFSYGDYLRSGSIAAVSDIINQIKNLAQKGKYIIGICNGFQILCEANLLPGSLRKNKDGNFICKNIYIKNINNNISWTSKLNKDQILKIQIANMDGNYYIDEDGLKYLYDNEMVIFKYCNKDGFINEESNINGSIDAIAAISNKEKNIIGMMPHPERFLIDNVNNFNSFTDGLDIFRSIIDSL